MQKGGRALMVSNLALLSVVFPSDGAASTAVKGLIIALDSGVHLWPSTVFPRPQSLHSDKSCKHSLRATCHEHPDIRLDFSEIKCFYRRICCIVSRHLDDIVYRLDLIKRCNLAKVLFCAVWLAVVPTAFDTWEKLATFNSKYFIVRCNITVKRKGFFAHTSLPH